MKQSKNYKYRLRELRTELLGAQILTGPEAGGKEGARTRPAEKRVKPQSHKNILLFMLENMAQIQDYYTISKNQARLSFWLAILNCLVGLVLLCLSVSHALTASNTGAAILSAIAGTIAELFAGTSLVVHNKSLKQLNHYYDALHEIEMFLSAVQLIGHLKPDRQDDVCIQVIQNELKLRYETAVNKSLLAVQDRSGQKEASREQETPYDEEETE